MVQSLADRIRIKNAAFSGAAEGLGGGGGVPVDSTRTLIGFDVHLIVVDIHFGDLHFKVVGQQLDGLPNGAHPWPPGSLEDLLQGRGVRPHGH